MRLTFLIFILFLLPYFGFAVEKSESVHQPKALIKEVLKLGVHNVDSALTVIQLKDSTANCDRGSFYRISTQKSSLYYYVGRVNSCRVGGCSVEMGTNEDYEYFDYFIIFNEEGEVDLVRVFNYQATHGQEITIKGWLKQFIGYNGASDLIVGSNVDHIAGATISTNAISVDVEYRTRLLKEELKR